MKSNAEYNNNNRTAWCTGGGQVTDALQEVRKEVTLDPTGVTVPPRRKLSTPPNLLPLPGNPTENGLPNKRSAGGGGTKKQRLSALRSSSARYARKSPSHPQQLNTLSGASRLNMDGNAPLNLADMKPLTVPLLPSGPARLPTQRRVPSPQK